MVKRSRREDLHNTEAQMKLFRSIPAAVVLGRSLVAVAPPGKGFAVLGADWMPDDRQWQTVLDHENAVVQEWNCSVRASPRV